MLREQINNNGKRKDPDPQAFLFVLLILFFLSCTTHISPEHGANQGLRWSPEDSAPKTVVILPFENESPEKGMGELERKSFYNHFSSKNYHDFELNEVDGVLEAFEQESALKWKDLSPKVIGDLFSADYIIHGRVKNFKKTYLGIYSQIALTVEIDMIVCEGGKTVWNQTVTKRSHEGGIPFSLFGIIPAALRSGLHMQHERTLDLVERVNRELTSRIPEPPPSPVSGSVLDIQVASFMERDRAESSLQSLAGVGLNPRIEPVILGDFLWYRVLLGPFHNRSKAQKARNRLLQDTGYKPIIIRRPFGKSP
jgi:hypothetical protein